MDLKFSLMALLVIGILAVGASAIAYPIHPPKVLVEGRPFVDYTPSDPGFIAKAMQCVKYHFWYCLGRAAPVKSQPVIEDVPSTTTTTLPCISVSSARDCVLSSTSSKCCRR